MSDAGILVTGVCVLALAYCAIVFFAALFADWADIREAERTAAATFEAAYIPDSSEVEGPDAEVDALIELAHIEDMLDDALATVRTWSQ